jgi:quercetin dioxygenase-like cupin family protein
MLYNKIQKFGDLPLSIYDFEFAGDILEKHNHSEENIHITIVARGKVKASSHDWEIEVSAGGVIDFNPNEPHEIEALEDNTRIINIVKKIKSLDQERYLK